MEEYFDRLLEKLDKTVSEISFIEWFLLMLLGVRIVTLIAD
jgi:hypothetical protein